MKLPPRKTDAHKGDFGRVLVIGGSRGMAGAISLTAMSALKTGSGLVSAAIPDRCLETVASFHPGVMTIPLADTPDGQFARLDDSDAQPILAMIRSTNAIACGPGMRTGAGAVQWVERLLWKTDVPRILDADALNVIAQQRFLDSPALPRDQQHLVLTPHPGELARLTGIPAAQRDEQIRAAESLVDRLGLTIVVKGGPTVVVYPLANGPARHVNPTGNPGMATAGSGDVLTGIIASLLGQGLSASDAARTGVHLHGLAGDLAAESISQSGMTCVEILTHLPVALRQLETRAQAASQ
ncbi:MAG: NAD(P)H-hydrate dehydratase [Planctomycetota bacterium]